MKKNIILTISIMVSGREKTTRKCLDSLQDLRELIPCELLLIDTGCKKEMREWLEDYADSVIDFTWCDDFAAARNRGVAEAQGEWFMFVDDDEWFEDTSNIISFFQSGEYKQYQTAFYKARNYADWDGQKYRDSYVSRMVKMQKDTRFIFPIHEVLMPALHPVKYLDDFVHHYGYVYESAEEEKAKTERNMPLLLKAHQESPHCLRHHMELAIEYNSVKAYRKSIEISYKGIQNYDNSWISNLKDINMLFANIVRCCNSIGEYEKACKEAARFIQQDEISALAVATICGDVTYSCYKTGNYERGLLYLEKYLQLKEVFEKDKQTYLEQQTMILESCFEKDYYQFYMATGAALAAAQGNWNKWQGIFRSEPVRWWEEAINFWCSKVSYIDIDSTRNGLESMVSAGDLYQQHLLICMDTWTLIKMTSQKKEEEGNSFSAYLRVLGSYSQRVILYYKNLYHISIFEEYPELLPKEYSLARKFQMVLQKVKQKDYVNALRELKNAAEMQTEFGEVIKKFSGMLSKNSRDQSEFANLAKQVKRKVWKMIREGENESARATLEQLQTLVPNDPEIELLHKRIGG